MEIKICIINYELEFVEVITNVMLTKKDSGERTWSKHEKVMLTKEKREETDMRYYVWRGDGHNDDDLVAGYEFIEGYSYARNLQKEEVKKIISMLESDKEWRDVGEFEGVCIEYASKDEAIEYFLVEEG